MLMVIFMLEIKNLTVKVKEKKILDNFSLTINEGEIHALMGQNGTGKSTLCRVIMHDDDYEVTSGEILYNGKDLTKMSTTNIAREKIFMLGQNPIAIEGVTNAEMLRTSLSEVAAEPINIFTFNQKMEEICRSLELPLDFIHREINVGMSGGERKKNELLHMWMLEPKLIFLDEVDSGLDVDALKIVAKSINDYYEKYKPMILIITHHNNLLEKIRPHKVDIIKNGTVIATGDYSLAKKVEKEGFKAFNISGLGNNE